MGAIGFTELSPESHLSGTATLDRQFIILKAAKNLTKESKLPAAVIDSLKGYRSEIEEELAALEGAPSVSSALREIRSNCDAFTLIRAIDTALTIVKNILISPGDSRVYRVKRNNPQFHSTLGRLPGSGSLMRAIGFVGNDNDVKAAAFVLRPLGAGFNASTVNSAGTSGFIFPSLDPDTEKFLYRRKADLELALRQVDKVSDNQREASTKSTSTTGKLSGAVGIKENERRDSKIGLAFGNSKKAFKAELRKGTLEFPTSLDSFLRNASPAQRAQINMIQNVFHTMDIDKGIKKLSTHFS